MWAVETLVGGGVTVLVCTQDLVKRQMPSVKSHRAPPSAPSALRQKGDGEGQTASGPL